MLVNENMININQLADYFIVSIDRDSGESLTNLKLQKLAYYSQAWHIAIYDSPLVEEEFEAWAHGPVSPTLYRRFSDYGFNAIPSSAIVTRPSELSAEITSYLEQVWARYGDIGAKALERLTHSEDPWINARKGYDPLDRSNETISKESMKEFYGAILKNAEE